MRQQSRQQPLESLLRDAAYLAGSILRDYAFSHGLVEWKKKDDPVTDLDKRVERELKCYFSARMPANFIGEEYGFENNNAPTTFIIDPIDGTKSFVKKDFLSCVSIGVEQEGKLIAGCVYDFMRDILYLSGLSSAGLIYRGNEIPFTSERSFSTINLHVDKSWLEVSRMLDSKPVFSPMNRGGSIALMMAQLASGCYDGILIPASKKFSTWDVAGGYAILQKSNCWITDAFGNPFNYKEPQQGLIALRAEIAQETLAAISQPYNLKNKAFPLDICPP